jgi:hypothetical protein
MKLLPILLLLLGLAGCALRPTWHWEKPGAGDPELDFDQSQCKAKVYAGNAGTVTNETVRRMFACMEGKGWRRVDN